MDDLTPVTRTERLLDGEDLTPTNREEMFIKRIYDKTQEIPEPVNRKEYFLKKAGEAGGDVTVVPLSVTENGTYSEEGKAYSPVTVEVAPPEDSYQLKSITTPTSLATFNASAMPMPSLKVSVEAKQEGSGTPSPENVRPISGWDEAKVSDVDDVENPTVTQTTTISLPQTVYGGELDVVNGTSGNKLTHGIVDLGTLDWQYAPLTSGLNRFQANLPLLKKPIDGDTIFPGICEQYKPVTFNETWVDGIIAYSGRYNITYISIVDERYTSAGDFKTAVSGVQLVYELEIPTTFATQPTLIKSLNGQNNLSVDCGEVIEGEYFIELGGE
jgi:hypothetical protein